MPVSSEAENVSWFEILEQFMDESFDGEEENNSYVVSEEDQLQQDAGELKVNRTHDLTPQSSDTIIYQINIFTVHQNIFFLSSLW